MLAAVLWLGNVSSAVIDNESHVEAVADEVYFISSYLLNMLNLKYIAFVHDLAAWKFKGQFGIAFQLAILVIKLGCSNCENKLIINPKQAGHSKLALSTRKMRMGNDNIVQKLTLSQAIDTRDALAKSVYSCLFDWLVEQINKSLAVGKRRTARSISILDIYGFESFDL
ncbi:hypothetical protein ACOSP7_031422 [Xanthoceras sorbifolium]